MDEKKQFRSNIQAIAWIKEQAREHGVAGFARMHKVDASRIRWVLGSGSDFIPPKLAMELGIEVVYRRKEGWK